MAATTDGNSLWEFALALYSSPGVEETTLHLQDELGANVNIVMWASWLETRAIPLTPGLLQEAEFTISAWDQEVVQVLRGVRRRVKSFEAESDLARELRALVKQAELLSERRCLSLLEEITTGPSGRNLKVGENVDFYLGGVSADVDLQPIRQALATFSAAKPPD